MIQLPKSIYDARPLGAGRIGTLGLQHLFAMFGGTVLVPVLVGLPVSTTLFCAGVGTLLFHLISQRKVPAFLGSSFTFVAVYIAARDWLVAAGGTVTEGLLYACLAIATASLLYFIAAGCIRLFGVERVLQLLPPTVVSPMIIAIGLTLAGGAITDCSTNRPLALLTILLMVVISVWGKGFLQLMPVLVSIVVSYAVASLAGKIDFTPVQEAAWIGLPFDKAHTCLGFTSFDWSIFARAVVMAIPLVIASIMEHIGDISAQALTTHRPFLSDPGLHRTLMGDGTATIIASLLGAPANTTYSQNTGALTITRVFDPMVVRVAAIMSIVISFCPKFSALIQVMPTAILGGIALILFGSICAVGIRGLIEAKIDLSDTRNVILVSMIIMLAVGIKYGKSDVVFIGHLPLSGLAIACLAGILWNLIFLLFDKHSKS